MAELQRLSTALMRDRDRARYDTTVPIAVLLNEPVEFPDRPWTKSLSVGDT